MLGLKRQMSTRRVSTSERVKTTREGCSGFDGTGCDSTPSHRTRSSLRGRSLIRVLGLGLGLGLGEGGQGVRGLCLGFVMSVS